MNHYGSRAKNLTMLTEFCQLNVASGAFSNGLTDTVAYYDLFFRNIPDDGGFIIAAGLSQVIDYLRDLHFDEEDLAYLRSTQLYSEDFLAFLKDFKFTCDVWAVPEGTPVFPYEPIVTVKGPLMQAQFIETMLLLIINHQSLIATKANRIVRAAEGREVYEFGARRSHGVDAALLGSRAAYIGGCAGTTQVLAAKELGIPFFTTMTHSWVQSFDSEYEAFAAFAKDCPNDCVLLVDTYNTIHSGVPNAIRVFDEILKPLGVRPKGIRIDSGDITYLTKKARRLLDEAGYADCAITVSNSLDEEIIRDMLIQGAKVDSFGVGERLITSASSPVLSGVYKLAAVEENGQIKPKIKISDNTGKITMPGVKTVWRLLDRDLGKAIADVVTLSEEEFDQNRPYELFDPIHTWKRKTVDNFVARRLLQPIFVGGKCVYSSPTLPEIQRYCSSQINTLWEEVTRFEKPHHYYVDLSQKLWQLRQDMLQRFSK
ncbi:MAG: nicotinate phosphoribosyltransferase [Clostridia bacterium]|nr:nicotinate phosphoribosyltransferase [Clostridia bacterium]